MPACFQLTRIGQTEPEHLQKIDDELWTNYTGAIPVPNDKWYANWYNIIGLSLACGKTFDDILENIEASGDTDNRLYAVARFLKDNYSTNAWYESK